MSRSRSAAGVGTPNKKKQRGGSSARAQAQREELARERVQGRIAGAVALISVACWIGALITANSSGGAAAEAGRGLNSAPLSSAKQLTDFHQGASNQAIATGLRCAGLALTVAFGLWLYRMAKARRGSVPVWLIPLTVVAGVLLAGSTVFGYTALDHVANEFVASGAQTSARAKHLIHHNGPSEVSAVLDLVSRIVFAAWIGAISLELSRTELLDRFLSYWAYFGAVALVLLPVGDAMFIAWLGSIGILALGYWPGGRPEGWTRIAKTA